jgi:hypothetical protein
MKQTAVEWVFQELDNYYQMKSKFRSKKEILKQAKELEKQQMRSSFVGCWITNVPNGIECKVDFEKWFEQFKK